MSRRSLPATAIIWTLCACAWASMPAVGDFAAHYGPSVALVVRKVSFASSSMPVGPLFDGEGFVRRGRYDLLHVSTPSAQDARGVTLTVSTDDGQGFAFVCDDDPSSRLEVELRAFLGPATQSSMPWSTFSRAIRPGLPLRLDDPSAPGTAQLHVVAYAASTDDSGTTLTSLATGTYTLSFSLTATTADGRQATTRHRYTVANTHDYYINCMLSQSLFHLSLGDFYSPGMVVNTTKGASSHRSGDVMAATLRIETNIPKKAIANVGGTPAYPMIRFVPLGADGMSVASSFAFHHQGRSTVSIPFSVVKNTVPGSGSGENRQWFSGLDNPSQSEDITVSWSESGKANGFLQSNCVLYVAPNQGTAAEYARDKGGGQAGFVPGAYCAWIRVEVSPAMAR